MQRGEDKEEVNLANGSMKRVENESPESDEDELSNRKRKTREEEATSASSVGVSKASGDTTGPNEDHESDPDLSTVEGQQTKHPNMDLEEARFQAKREYNRLNAARARVRNKEILEELHGKVATLSKRTEELERENEVLRAQVKVLAAQQQSFQSSMPPNAPLQTAFQPPQRYQGLPGAPTDQTASSLAVALLGGLLQGASNRQPLFNNDYGNNPLTQLLPSLHGAPALSSLPPAPPASQNSVEGLTQLLLALQSQQQQTIPPQPQIPPPPADLQNILSLLGGIGNTVTSSPEASLPFTPGFPSGVTQPNAKMLLELLAQQQQQQQQQQAQEASTREKNSDIPPAFMELLAKTDPRQNVLASILQGGQTLSGNQEQSSGEMPSLQIASNSSAGTSQGRTSSEGPSGQSDVNVGADGQPHNSSSQPFLGRDQINQLLPTLSPKTLYSILRQQNLDSQQRDKPGDSKE